MSSSTTTTNNFSLSSDEWFPGRDYNYDLNGNVYGDYRSAPSFMIPLRIPSLSIPAADRGARDTWQALEERLLMEPPGLYRSNRGDWVPTDPPIPVLLISNGIERENLQGIASVQEEDSRLTQEEQTRALKKLKKEIYNPVTKKMTKRLCIYYRDRARHVANERAKEKEEDEKKCAVCLEDFVPKEMVTTTPCRHMFHEECIVPWAKSHGRCPICRLVLWD
uniref:E3 ubiquitin-protein ligase TTC3 n=1 Tax=Rhizophora mucronata TaxID=61149 RepID=A0A2P2NIQ5_RHIMU